MSGKSPVSASEEQRIALTALAGSRDRGEADRARAVLLTLSGWTSARIAEAFSVREDTVRLWRSDFSRGGIDALKASVAPGPSPMKSETALRVITPLLEEPVANRANWTIARMRTESRRARTCSSAVRNCPRRYEKKVPLPAAAAHAERTPNCQRGRSDRLASATAPTAGRSR
jgi:transposase